jgi:hypothetical protein
MLDQVALTKLVEQQVASSVNDRVQEVMAADEWLASLEDKILSYTQDRILAKFNNSSTMPEIVEAVKNSVTQLFEQGHVPGIDQFIDDQLVTQSVNIAVQNTIETAISQLGQDAEWLSKIENLVNQSVVQETLTKISSLDIDSIIRRRVDENMSEIREQVLTQFASTGISDQATQCQFTVMDEATVVENKLVAADLQVMNGVLIKDLAVTGSINTDNQAWTVLADNISETTLNKLSDKWRDELVQQVAAKIKESGVDFTQVTIDGEYLVSGPTLSKAITESNLQSVGKLKELTVLGKSQINNVSIGNRRVGINTDSPEMALSIWDEEVAVIIGKHKEKQAFVGTSRNQTLTLGVNRTPHLEIDDSGLTTVKKLQIGVHKISHATQVPGWSGTKGDIVFNTNPGADRVFAWVCIGAFNWQVLKAAE